MMPTSLPESTPRAADASVLALLQRHWGYPGYLPNQEEAVDCVLTAHDSLTILPTGGGKSMCYQLPALAREGLAVVVSPLLALMKDQVDALRANGIAAAALNSTLSADERRQVATEVRDGRLKLLYVSPEGLGSGAVVELLRQATLSFIAIDEAHCISQWGHDYRADYRNLGMLREWFPNVSVHAFTATATPTVREDIVESLRLRDARVIVGDFDRPNLIYRASYRKDVLSQIEAVIARHPGEGGIVYAISRNEVESLAAALAQRGHKARPYHAGMSAEERQRNQEAFVSEQIDLIVATVAFGMGIDRSNVRFVVHAGMPKAIENYQQEAGRAGRDRLEAECVLIYSAQDLMAWRRIMGNPTSEYDQLSQDKLNEMYRFSRTLTCRHRFLVQYFGQPFHPEPCGACDVCFGEHAELPDSLITAQKILSCVARVRERFGARYVAEVLKGSKTAKVLQNQHDQLSTYGLLAEYSLTDLSDWIDQLTVQGFLVREGEYQVLRLTDEGRRLLKGDGLVRLTLPREAEKAPARKRAGASAELSGPEGQLFEALRAWRRDVAKERGVPPYVIFNDATLRELALERPDAFSGLLRVKGIGESKARTFGEALLVVLRTEANNLGLTLSSSAEAAPLFAESPRPQGAPAPVEDTPSEPKATRGQREEAFRAFRDGLDVEAVAARTGRATSTVEGYLMEFIQEEGVDSPEPWLPRSVYEAVLEAAARVQAERLKPIFEALDGAVPYGQIRLALAIRANAWR